MNLWTLSVGNLPNNEVSGSFSFSRFCQTAFKVIALIYTPISHVGVQSSNSSTSSPTLAIVYLVFLATLIDGCEVVMGLVCIVLMVVEVEYHFSCLLPICIFSLVINSIAYVNKK